MHFVACRELRQRLRPANRIHRDTRLERRGIAPPGLLHGCRSSAIPRHKIDFYLSPAKRTRSREPGGSWLKVISCIPAILMMGILVVYSSISFST
jgi:hypothetical protein